MDADGNRLSRVPSTLTENYGNFKLRGPFGVRRFIAALRPATIASYRSVGCPEVIVHGPEAIVA